MKDFYTFVFVTLITISSILCKDEPKLQVGVKKRVECSESSKIKRGDFVHIHYKGTLKDGSVFDSSYEREEPFTFSLGKRQVIIGLDQGVLGMCKGEKRRLVIPPELGYGDASMHDKIPPNSTLIFDVELVKIESHTEL